MIVVSLLKEALNEGRKLFFKDGGEKLRVTFGYLKTWKVCYLEKATCVAFTLVFGRLE
jgi:hypothetical protein